MVLTRGATPSRALREGCTWSWLRVRSRSPARGSWVATVRPDGAPNVLPVWGAWMEGAVWFSSSFGSRRARNLAADPRCTITNDDPQQPVSVQGVADRITDPELIEAYTAVTNEKYAVDYEVGFYTENALFAVRPIVVFALTEADFA